MTGAAIEVGIHPTLSFDEYHAIDAWGSSSLRAMRRGPPARVLWERENDCETDATRLGQAVHCRLLTPALFESIYAHKPDGMNFSTKDGKAWRAEHAHFSILSHEEWTTVEAIVEALQAKRTVAESLADAELVEGTLVWRCPGSGELCKGRMDWMERRARRIVDLKVTRVAGTHGVGPKAYYQGWMHQQSHYRTGAVLNGIDIRHGCLVMVEPTPPHFVYTFEVKVDALDLLELENVETLRQLRECRLADDFPGTEERWSLIEPPPASLVGLGDVTLLEQEEEHNG